MAIDVGDIQRLIQEPSVEVRTAIAQKVSNNFGASNFTQREREIAIEIFRLLVHDTAKEVRKAIADNLKHNDDVPHDVIRTLADDIYEVAEGIIEFSKVLTDDDLIELINNSSEVRKLLAISRRENLSGMVSASLIDTKNNKVIHSLLKNESAEIYDREIQRLMQTYRNNSNILDAMVTRGGITACYAEKLYSMVAKKMTKQLIRRHRLIWRNVSEAVTIARDAKIISFLSKHMSDDEMWKLIEQMHNNKRLNYSLVFRALSVGEARFFEMSVAIMSGISYKNAVTLLRDKGGQGFDTCYRTSNMPEGFCDAVRTLYRLTLELSDNNFISHHKFQLHMVELIVQRGYHRTVENMGYFLSMMKQAGKVGTTVH